MRSRKEGDWYITTPLYVGSKEQVAKMQACEHKAWADSTDVVKDGYHLFLQRCMSCNAARSRYKPLGKDEHNSIWN